MNVKAILAAKQLGGDTITIEPTADSCGGGEATFGTPHRRGADPRRRRAPLRHFVGA